MQLETKRLILREFAEKDFPRLYEILSDGETMKYYPAPFDEVKVRRWIAVNQERYRTFGFGLWAVVLKETGEVIGDCGVTMQNIHGVIRPEIGYHIGRPWQRQGYASEAAICCRDFMFEHTPFQTLYSYMKHTNAASYGVAVKNGMCFIEEYNDPVNVRTRVYAITREAWMALKNADRRHDVLCACEADVEPWMALVERVAWNFPGLETPERIRAHRETVLRFMAEGRALCVKRDGRIVGILLLSTKRNMICCMAVDPGCRRQGIGSALLEAALKRLDRSRDITVSTFREEDEKGIAPRALYRRFGFEPGALHNEYGYPDQQFILAAKEVRA
ncbi:MAG: GNAT family N-acetyltransferase [Clostridia bacterium]|nr:GNAT family N-acetyltransferase [Clostridia bacterium]